MREFLKKNFALVLAFALPVVLIVSIALSTHLPALFLSTKYDFVYTSCTDSTGRYSYRCYDYLQERYSVVNGRIVVTPNSLVENSDKNYKNKGYIVRIFLHDTKKNESQEITLEKAQTFLLNKLLTSPDGVTISSDYNRETTFSFLFGSSISYDGYYLTKGKRKKKLNLINSDTLYQSFQLLGWVLPDRK